MLNKMTELAIKEMDAFYGSGKAMMGYFEKQLQSISRLTPWMAVNPQDCGYGKDLAKPFMAAMGMVSQSDYRTVEKKSIALGEQLEAALNEIELHQKSADAQRHTIADQANALDKLKKLTKAELAELKKETAEQKTLIADQEKKLAETTAALEETRNTIISQEKELKADKKQLARMEKDIAGLKSQVESFESESQG